ncbi:MAG: Rne/Rng family ribonuclease [Elusimicrobia bacterium]|nr:Rne/Rng family ribonuclease [Elusimicrobiota bacterium]
MENEESNISQTVPPSSGGDSPHVEPFKPREELPAERQPIRQNPQPQSVPSQVAEGAGPEEAPMEESPASAGGGSSDPAGPESVQGALPGSSGRRRRRRRGRRGHGQGHQGQGQGPQQVQGRPEEKRGERQERGGQQQRHDGQNRREEGRHPRGENQPAEARAEGQRSGESARHHERAKAKPIKREVLANTSFEETRIAILEDGTLTELLWERKSEESIVGNIYKGVVENVLPGISSAFVNIGYDKNAYLYISDVLGERGASIDSTLKKGQHIIVQVAKEAIGTKGMKITMDVSLPGRYLVFTPFQTAVGLSKNIEDVQERRRLESIVTPLAAKHLGGKGMVVRTEAEGASAEELEREVKYLMATWTGIQKRFDSMPPPALLHKDLDLTLQVARDILSDEVYVYLIDNKESYRNVTQFVEEISPLLKERVRYYDGKTPIFKAFNLENEIENLRKPKVQLPNGGSIVIQEAESLCAIDVNTGRFTGSKSQEETVTQTNIEAAQEIAHQIRLRNIGGIIVVDFIDMKKASNRNKVMEAFQQAVKNDRAKIRILPITRLGLIEMTRERKRESTVSLITDECPQCKGSGRVLSAETMRIRIQREIYEMTAGRPGGQIRILLHPLLAEAFRSQQVIIEKNVQRSVKIQSDPQLQWEDYRIILE